MKQLQILTENELKDLGERESLINPFEEDIYRRGPGYQIPTSQRVIDTLIYRVSKRND